MNKKKLILLAGIILLGSLLRFYGLEFQSLWNDELASWRRSSFDHLSPLIQEVVKTQLHPPGYDIFLHHVNKYFGDSEKILRLPSAISGVMIIFMTFLMGTYLYSCKEGLIASAMMAVLWCPIYYSQEARPYSLLLLFSLVSMYGWVSILKDLDENRRPHHFITAVYIISAILCAYLHYFGLYFVMLQGTGSFLFILNKRKAFLYILTIYFAIFIAYLPWLPDFYYQLKHNQNTIRWVREPDIETFIKYMKFVFNRSLFFLIIASIMYVFLIVHMSKYLLRNIKSINIINILLYSDSLLFLWLTIPYIGAYVVSNLMTPVLTFRNLIVSIPAAYLLLARSITKLTQNSTKLTIVTFLIMVMFLFNLIFTMHYYSKAHKDQFRETVNFIIEKYNSYENSLIIGCAWHKDYFNYYFKKRGSEIRVDIIAGKKEDRSKVLEVINENNPKYIWYIRAHRKPDSEFIDFLNEYLEPVLYKKFLRADVCLFENKF